MLKCKMNNCFPSIYLIPTLSHCLSLVSSSNNSHRSLISFVRVIASRCFQSNLHLFSALKMVLFVTVQTQTLTLETSLNEAALKILFSFKNNSLISYIEKPTPVPTPEDFRRSKFFFIYLVKYM